MTTKTHPLNSEVGWATLIHRCQEVQAKLKKLSCQLNQPWVKGWLLGEASRRGLRQDIAEVGQAVSAIAQAAEVMRATPELHLLRQLEAQMEQLAEKKAALQVGRPNQPTRRLVHDMINLLTPPFALIWGFLLKMEILNISSLWVKVIPFVASGVVLLINNSQQIYLRFLNFKREDKMVLVEQIDLLIHTFEKIEDKMHASDTLELRQAVEAQIERQSAAMTAINGVIHGIADELAKLKDENAELKETNGQMKEMMEKILKAVGGQPS